MSQQHANHSARARSQASTAPQTEDVGFGRRLSFEGTYLRIAMVLGRLGELFSPTCPRPAAEPPEAPVRAESGASSLETIRSDAPAQSLRPLHQGWPKSALDRRPA
jgi:hypothetical protein